MKTNKPTLLSTAALAVGAFLLLAPNAMAADTKAKLNSADSRFIQQEAASGAALVRIAELGAEKAERADVKAFAGKLVTDHTKANAELATLAGNKGVELSQEVDSKHTDTYENLGEKSGADFDKVFLATVVSSHKKCVKNFEDAAEDAEDTEVKQWAAKMLPAHQAHLEKAEALSSGSPVKTGATSGTTSGTTVGRTSAAEPDNTARNKRDRNAGTLTPLDQGNSKTDIDTTARIRKEILNLENLSVNARNVKIITNAGHVTLRGPVSSEEEKRLIAEIATRIATAEHTDNQLEVEADDTAN